VVVTNHALLAIDALENGIVLPEHDLVVVDEAHDLVDRVTGVATAELTTSTVHAAAKRCARLIDQAITDRLAEAGYPDLTRDRGQRSPRRFPHLVHPARHGGERIEREAT